MFIRETRAASSRDVAGTPRSGWSRPGAKALEMLGLPELLDRPGFNRRQRPGRDAGHRLRGAQRHG
ncbi:MAG: hypothetical protein OXF73_03115 [Gammaproteobacteria bacterium]|nr:hypothetical protein [Gammaproteobacteria bacterium]MCY4228525.1 hypothetical protein [Gammaproteobacteria bacterium]